MITRQRIVLVLLSIIAGLYLAEIILELLPPVEFLSVVRDQNLPEPDYREKIEIIAELLESDPDTIPAFSPRLLIGANQDGPDRLAPLSGLSSHRTFLCNEYGKLVFYDADRHGFNNPPGIYDGKSVDLILIGDSFVHGNCVDPGDDIAGQLRSGGLNALNLGFLGLGPLSELAVLREYGPFLQPPVVLWFYFEGNDQRNLLEERDDPILAQYLADPTFSQDLFNRQDEMDQVVLDYYESFAADYEERNLVGEQFQRVMTLSNLQQEIRNLTVSEEAVFQKNVRYDLETFEAVLRAGQEAVSRWGGELYFVYLPAKPRYDLDCSSCSDLYQKRQVLSVVENLGIAIIDMEPAFNAHPDPTYLIPGHYNAEGYALVAEEIYNRLQTDDLTQ